LVNIKDDGYYDSGIATVVWTPIVQQPRALYESRAQFVTPVFDSFDVATTWDRIVLDACLPPDTAITIESRAGDEFESVLEGSPPDFVAAQVIGSWMPEPSPILRSNGPELPFLRREAARATRRENGVGAWDLLLQTPGLPAARLTLTSASGMATPRLRALRAWSPRFSIAALPPAVYREDATAVPSSALARPPRTGDQRRGTVVNVQASSTRARAGRDARVAGNGSM
jgi:hypothetical protein